MNPISRRLFFPIYTTGYAIVTLAAAPYYLIQGRRTGKYLWSLAARLGRLPPDLPSKQGLRVWVHALSLGEVNSSLELIRGLEAAGCQVCLSTTTKSGHEAAARHLARLPRFSLPLDLPGAVDRIITVVQPDLFVLVETDIWPNFLAGLVRRQVPAVLVSARVSPRSQAGYRLVKGFWGRVLNLFAGIGAQSPEDLGRLILLGADPARALVTGSLKYDRPPTTGRDPTRADLLAETGLPDGIWLVAGSTHSGDEEVLLNLLARLRTSFPDLGLLLAPRDPARFAEVWRLIASRDWPAARRSIPGNQHLDRSMGPRVFLLDTLGELDRFYELADLVFIGKSLPGKGEGGGQNPIEPAARGKPIIFGPRMHNFAEMARLLTQSGGAVQVPDAGALEKEVRRLLVDPAAQNGMGKRAAAVVAAHRGAVARTLALIESVISGRIGLKP